MLDAQETDHKISVVCAVLGTFWLFFGLTSHVVRGRLFLSTAVVALLLGILLGPRLLRVLWILPSAWEVEREDDTSKDTLLWFTRIILGIQITTSAVTLPSRILARPTVAKSLFTLLGPAMVVATAIVAALAKAAFPEIGWRECFVIGACLAPTDPILAASVVKGVFAEKHVPPYIRDLLLCESGINDGLGALYWLLPVLTLSSSHVGGEFAKEGILQELVISVLAAGAMGTSLRLLWNAAKRRHWVDKESRLVWTLALSLATTGLFELLGLNELLGCFICGIAMNWDGGLHEDDLHSHFSDGIDAILDVAVFTTLGTILPWPVWLDPSPPVTLGRLFGFGVGVLALRRLPVVLVLKRMIPEVRTVRESLFVGWFGPMGIGAIYYALKTEERVPPHNVLKQELSGIITWVVFLSTLVHGITIPMFLLGSTVHSSLHPHFLVQEGGGEAGDEDEGEDSPLLGGDRASHLEA